ncbi:MAG: GGDEF domain-containing protein, partial [Chloroflexota bacterium]
MRDGRVDDRAAFLHALDASLASDPATVGVVRIDLDRFSRIGETFGPAVARTVGAVIQSRMQAVAGSPDRLLEYGNDSYVAIVSLADVAPETLESTGMDIVDLVSSPIDIAGERIAVGSNAGIAAAVHFPEPEALRLLAAAELAIQRADALGSRRVMVYEVTPRHDPTRLPRLFADM